MDYQHKQFWITNINSFGLLDQHGIRVLDYHIHHWRGGSNLSLSGWMFERVDKQKNCDMCGWNVCSRWWHLVVTCQCLSGTFSSVHYHGSCFIIEMISCWWHFWLVDTGISQTIWIAIQSGSGFSGKCHIVLF